MSDIGELNEYKIRDMVEKLRRVEALALHKSQSENPYDRIVAELIYKALDGAK